MQQGGTENEKRVPETSSTPLLGPLSASDGAIDAVTEGAHSPTNARPQPSVFPQPPHSPQSRRRGGQALMFRTKNYVIIEYTSMNGFFLSIIALLVSIISLIYATWVVRKI